MGENAKRRWFQVHMSTAVVLMVVAGILLFWNIGLLQTESKDRANPFVPAEDIQVIRVFRLIVFLTSVLILITTTILSEYVIRRREARKP